MKIDDTEVKLLRDMKAAAEADCLRVKDLLHRFQVHIKATSSQSVQLRQNLLCTDSDVDCVYKGFLQLNDFLPQFLSEEQKAINLQQSCVNSKMNTTRAMVTNLNSIGNVLLDLHHTQVSIKSLEQTLQQLAPSIYELRKIYRLRETYEASLKEIVRRQAYAKKVGSLLQSHKQMAKKLQTDEIDQRLTFSALHSEFLLSQLVPFLMKTEEEHRKLPVMEISNRRGLFLD